MTVQYLASKYYAARSWVLETGRRPGLYKNKTKMRLEGRREAKITDFLLNVGSV